jgi:hypothetical protein
MAEKAVADYLSLMGKKDGWRHRGQCGSRARRSTVNTLAHLQGTVRANQRRHRHTELVMTNVAAAIPSTARPGGWDARETQSTPHDHQLGNQLAARQIDRDLNRRESGDDATGQLRRPSGVAIPTCTIRSHARAALDWRRERLLTAVMATILWRTAHRSLYSPYRRRTTLAAAAYTCGLEKLPVNSLGKDI